MLQKALCNVGMMYYKMFDDGTRLGPTFANMD